MAWRLTLGTKRIYRSAQLGFLESSTRALIASTCRPLDATESSQRALVAARWFSVSPQADVVESSWKLLSQRVTSDEDWEALCRRVQDTCPTLRGDEIVRVLHALTIARRRAPQVLATLKIEILDKLPQFSTGGLCLCLHAYAQLRAREAELFNVCARRLLHESLRSELTTEHLTSLLYSYARVLVGHKGLLAYAPRKIAADAGHLSAEDLATILQSMATLRVHNDRCLSACAQAVLSRVSHAPLPALCDSLHALARLDAAGPDLQRKVASRCICKGALSELQIQSLVRLLGGLAGSEQPLDTQEAFDVATEALKARLDELDSPKQLVDAFEALARTKYMNLGPLSRKIVSLMADFSSKDLASVATSCAELSLKDRAMLEAIARQGQARGKRLRSFQLESLFNAFDGAGFEHAVVTELRREYAERSERKSHERGSAIPDNAEVFQEFDEEDMSDKAVSDKAKIRKPAPVEEDEFFMEPWDRDEEKILNKEGPSRSRGRRSAGRMSQAAGDEDEVEEDDQFWPRRAVSQRTSKHVGQHPMENLFQDGDFHPVGDPAQKLDSGKDDRDFRRALSNVLKPEGLVYQKRVSFQGGKGRRLRPSVPFSKDLASGQKRS